MRSFVQGGEGGSPALDFVAPESAFGFGPAKALNGAAIRPAHPLTAVLRKSRRHGFNEPVKLYVINILPYFCSKLLALWSFSFSYQATSVCKSENRRRPVCLIALSGTS
jgi:hypothetical protein